MKGANQGGFCSWCAEMGTLKKLLWPQSDGFGSRSHRVASRANLV